MSSESKSNTKLAAQKEALGLYLDSLLGGNVFEPNCENDEENTEKQNSEAESVVKKTKILDDNLHSKPKTNNTQADLNNLKLENANSHQHKNTQLENSPERDINSPEPDINSLEPDTNSLERKITNSEQDVNNPEPVQNIAKTDTNGHKLEINGLLDTGSLSVKYLKSVALKEENQKATIDERVYLDSSKDKSDFSVKQKGLENQKVKKVSESVVAKQMFLQQSSEKQLQEEASDEIANAAAAINVEDSHDIYRQKLLDRQKQVQERKKQRQIERKKQASMISLLAKDKDGKENKQVLVPRSQFLRNQQLKSQPVGQGHSQEEVNIEQKLKQKLNDKQPQEELSEAPNHAAEQTSRETLDSFEENQAQFFSDSENQSIIKPSKSSIMQKAAKPFAEKKDSGTHVAQASISAFSEFAKRNQDLRDEGKSKNEALSKEISEDSTINEKLSGIKNFQAEVTEMNASKKNNSKMPEQHEASTKEQRLTKPGQQLKDAPDLDLSLFLPKVPTLAEIEAIEQKEQLLKAQSFAPDLNSEIKAQGAEPTIIKSGLEISTLPVSPHSQRSKNSAPKWAEPSFQAMFFDVAGLKLAIPVLELNGIVEWGKDYITPMPGHEKWYLGLLQFRGKSAPIIDTLQQVFPPNQVNRLMKVRKSFGHIIMIDDGNWGLACEQIIGIRTIAADAVKWRTDQTKRRWLLGTVKDQMCALLDSKEFAAMLKTGKDSLLNKA